MLAWLLCGRDSRGRFLWSLASTSPQANHAVVLFLGWLEHGKFLLSLPSKRGRRKGSSDFATDSGHGRHYCLTQGEYYSRTTYLAASSVLTRPPQLQALVFIGETHATVAIGLPSIAGSPINLVRVGGAKRWLASAVFREVTESWSFPAGSSWGHQLERYKWKIKLIIAWLLCGLTSAQCLPVDKKKSCIHLFIHLALGFLRSAVIQMTL